MIFVFNGKFHGSNTDYMNDYNEPLKISPIPSRQQIQDSIANFFMKKNTNKIVTVKLTTYYALSIEEKQNVAIVFTNIRAYSNNMKSLYVGFHKHSQRSSNIF